MRSSQLPIPVPGRVARLLHGLQQDRDIASIVRRSHRLVHAIAGREWIVISPAQRADEHLRGRSAVEELERSANLEALRQQLLKRFAAVSGRLEVFCEDLVAALRQTVATAAQADGGLDQPST
jgi:hypothetical protein